ncbi:DUF397 domain-containing protein [Streptomyces sp. SYSU K21746]
MSSVRVPADVRWRKSSYSDDKGGECVEVASVDRLVAIRDSKQPDGPVLAVSPAAFSTFVAGIGFGIG